MKLPGLALLRCPATGARLRPLAEAEPSAGLAGLGGVRQFGPGETSGAIFAEGSEWAYAIADGIPVLLVAEALRAPCDARDQRTADTTYDGIYRDLRHYTRAAARARKFETTIADHGLAATFDEAARAAFPEPPSRWLARREGVYDNAAELEAYRHIAPIAGRRVLQAGGRGAHAVKFLLAGASEAWLLTPFLEEARFGQSLARRCGVEDRFRAVVAVAEAPALEPGAFDAIYSPGSLHHTAVERALRALIGLLAPGGRLAAVDPWRAPGYGLGTRLLGKREREVGCRPLSGERLAAARREFPGLRVSQHGALTRYAMIAAGKGGLRLPRSAVLHILQGDDRLSGLVPGLRRLGSSVCLSYRK